MVSDFHLHPLDHRGVSILLQGFARRDNLQYRLLNVHNMDPL
jgi:hypothetical protein